MEVQVFRRGAFDYGSESGGEEDCGWLFWQAIECRKETSSGVESMVERYWVQEASKSTENELTYEDCWRKMMAEDSTSARDEQYWFVE